MNKLLLLCLLACSSLGQEQKHLPTIGSFSEAKKHLPEIHKENPTTLYCNCKFEGKKINLESCGYRVHKNNRRAQRLEWEHVVPAHAFGHSFAEWRKGGRKMARKNPEFRKMEGDMHNLWPEVGEINQLRSNYSMTDFGDNEKRQNEITFGGCQARIADRKFEPMNNAKGIVARTYFYMDLTYPGRGIISRKNAKLFEAWDKMYPVTDWECKRSKKVERIQNSVNPVLTERCRGK
jgi:deoxyribonuclease I